MIMDPVIEEYQLEIDGVLIKKKESHDINDDDNHLYTTSIIFDSDSD